MSRIIVFTGKGGVGKTLISSAHALASSAQGVKTLLVSTDPAHNIGDMFEMKVGSSPVRINEYLDALELDPDLIMRSDFPDFMGAWHNILGSAGIKKSEQDQFTVIPGLESLFSLMKITQIYEQGEYERIMVDCAPTGETLSMLKLPELLSWYFEKFFPVSRVAFRILSPVTRTFLKVDMPDKEAMYDAEKMYLELIKIQDLLKDSSVCSVRLVCTPEKMVVDETKRSFMYLNLYHYNVDGIYVNRIIPRMEDNDFFEKWYDIQSKYIKELESVFAGVSMTKLRWYPNEIRGMEALDEFCREYFREADLEQIFSVRVVRENESFTKEGDNYCLTLVFPFGDDKEIKTSCNDLDVTIHAGNQVRAIPLPYTLKGSRIKSSEYKDGHLKIIFEAGEEGFRI